MKNLMCIVLLVCSFNLFAQSNIESDELYLKYEKEYLNYLKDVEDIGLNKLDKMESDFYNSFKNQKLLESFLKSSNKLKWIDKNSSKLDNGFKDKYNDILNIRMVEKEKASAYLQILDQLIIKYDRYLIWNTIKNRLVTK